MRNRFLYTFLLSMTFIGSGHAEEIDYFSLPAEQLLAAEVVSVSKKTEKVADIAAAVFVITQDDIARSGVTTIPEALRMAPGVQVAQADSNNWAISIRGFNGLTTNKLLVMIDGRSVYNPLFAGTYWELQDYVLEDIERIEIIRGPGGSIWGANAVNGVINIITKNSSNTQGNFVSALYGNEENGTLSARHGGSFGQDRYYRVYAKAFQRDSFQAPAGGASNDEWEGGRGGFRADWGNNFTLQGDLYRVLSDQTNSLVVLPAPIIEDETIQSQGANLLAQWQKNLDNGDLVSVKSYLDYTYRDQILLEDERQIFDTEVQYNFAPSGRHEVITGIGYRMTHDQLRGSDSVRVSPDSRLDHLFNVFVQDKITLSDQWFLTLGSKFEHNDYSGFEFQPNARLQYQPDASQTLWTSISRAVRTPSRLEHDIDLNASVLPGPTLAFFQANDDFDSEELTAYEAGYRKQINPELSLDIATFFNDYDNLATVGFLTPSPGQFPVQTINGMRAKTYGFEVASNWKISNDFQLSGSYSFIDIFQKVDNDNGFDLETDEGLTPHHQAHLRASWNMSESVKLDTNVYYVGKLSQDDVKDNIRLDLNLGWQIQDNVRFNLVGQNLLNDAHREFSPENSLNAAEVQRSVFGKISWDF